MKAAVLHEPNAPLAIEEVSLRKPGPREVLIRTAYAGLCHSDLHVIEGLFPYPLPAVLGHESSGIVEQTGSEVTHVQPGDHVITCLSVFCGACEHCLSGLPAACSDPSVKPPPAKLDRLRWERPEKLHTFTNLSSFAEQMLVHENAVVKIRRDMPLDRAALIGCGVMTGFGAAANAAGIRWGESVAVVGCGGVGLAAVEGARIAGAGRIIAVDTNPDKLRLAETLGATDTVNAAEADPVEAIRELTAGGVHHAIECLGRKATAEQCFAMLRVGGTATVVGMLPKGEKIAVDGLDLMRERRLQGSLMGSGAFRVEMPRLVDLYFQGRLHLDTWISDVLPLGRINEGFAKMKAGQVVRAVIAFD